MHINRNVFPRAAIALSLALTSVGANALSLPSLGSSNNYDEFRTSSGMVCRQSISGSAQLQIGGVASQDNSDDIYSGSNWNNRNYNRDESGVFVQLVVPIGVPDRIDCTTLYDIEVEKQQIELKQVKAQLEMLQKQAALAGLKLPDL